MNSLVKLTLALGLAFSSALSLAAVHASAQLDLAHISIETPDGSVIPLQFYSFEARTQTGWYAGYSDYSNGDDAVEVSEWETAGRGEAYAFTDKLSAEGYTAFNPYVEISSGNGAAYAGARFGAGVLGHYVFRVPYTFTLQRDWVTDYASVDLVAFSRYGSDSRVTFTLEGDALSTSQSGFLTYELDLAQPELKHLEFWAHASTLAPIPEPETYALMGMGIAGLAAARRFKKKR